MIVGSVTIVSWLSYGCVGTAAPFSEGIRIIDEVSKRLLTCSVGIVLPAGSWLLIVRLRFCRKFLIDSEFFCLWSERGARLRDMDVRVFMLASMKE